MDDDLDALLDNLNEAERNSLLKYVTTDKKEKIIGLQELALQEETTNQKEKKPPQKLKLHVPESATVVKPDIIKPRSKSCFTDFDVEANAARMKANEEEVFRLLETATEEDILACQDLLDDPTDIGKKRDRILSEGAEPNIDDGMTIDELVEKYGQNNEDVLNLTNNYLSFLTAYKLFLFLGSQKCNIKKLILSNCNLTDTHIPNLAQALAQNKTIVELNIETNNISQTGFCILFDELKAGNFTLATLRMCNQASPMHQSAETRLIELVENRENLISVSYDSKSRYTKDKIERIIMRNKDNLRKNRALKDKAL